MTEAAPAGGKGVGTVLRNMPGDGPPLLMIHGFGADRLSWLANQNATAAFRNVFTLDLPGHADSAADIGDGSVAAIAAHVAEALDSHGIGALDLVGHSLGGAIALSLAIDRPDRVRSLVLVSPAGLGQGVDPGFLAAFPELRTEEEAMELLRRLFVRPRLVSPLLAGRVLDQLHRPGAREALRRIGGRLSADAAVLAATADRVATLGIPRLVIWGEEDAINPRSSERLDAFGGETTILDGAGHLPHVENPRGVNAAIADFLARQPG